MQETALLAVDNLNRYEREYHIKLSENQRKFIIALSTTFTVRSVANDNKPYIPEPYQIDFHKDLFMIAGEKHNRIWNKGRGVGFSMMIMMEALLVADRIPNMVIPVVSYKEQAAKDLIEWGYWLAKNSNHQFKIIGENAFSIHLANGSSIRSIPGGNPDSLRGIRTKFMVFDEFAHCDWQDKLLYAGDRCLSEGGQRVIGSSPKGKQNDFWKLWERSRKGELQDIAYYTPVFDPTKFNPQESVIVQVKRGLKSISPWINIQKLEEGRRQDIIAFMQENQADPQDTSTSFLDFDLIERMCILKPENVLFGYQSQGVLHMGIDVARSRDMTSITVMEKTDLGFKMIYMENFTGVTIPAQAERMKAIANSLKVSYIRIDKSGMGVGLYDILRQPQYIGSKITGIDFTKQMKEKLATHMRALAHDNKVFLFNDDILKQDLHSVEYGTLQAESSDIGHADRFWSVSLALYDEFSIAMGMGSYNAWNPVKNENIAKNIETTGNTSMTTDEKLDRMYGKKIQIDRGVNTP